MSGNNNYLCAQKCQINASNEKKNILILVHRCCTSNIKTLALTVEKLLTMFIFFNVGQTTRSQRKILVPRKGLFTENIHVKYQSCSNHSPKVITNLRLNLQTDLQNDRQDKNIMSTDLRSRGRKNNDNENFVAIIKY